ncbi:MAG TPA: hypothetical protein VNF68_05930 [Candidatus Baltobacteraceae bacterium]|nr:hypothetical protein [Candidatus Baltobacteraceae bacterium]
MSDLLSLQRRIEALERRTTSLRRMLVITLGLFVIAATIATTQAQQKSVTFADSAGHVRVRINADGFHLYDAKGVTQLVLGSSTSNHPVLAYYDGSGAQRMRVGFSTFPYIDMAGPNGKDLIELTADSSPRAMIFDSSNTERLYMGMTSENDPLLRMYSGAGHQTMALEGQDKPFLRFNQGDGTERGYLGVATEGSSMLKLFSTDGTERAYAGEFTDGTSGFASYNASGTATWSSP